MRTLLSIGMRDEFRRGLDKAPFLYQATVKGNHLSSFRSFPVDQANPPKGFLIRGYN